MPKALLRMTSFGTIRNNIALKHIRFDNLFIVGFGTIRNNIALKQWARAHRHS